MSGQSQEDPLRPLLQTVCHAGLITLAAVMADQAHQLPHLGLNRLSGLPHRQPPVRLTNKEGLNTEAEGRVSGGSQETEKAQTDAQTDSPTSRLLPDERVTEEEEKRVANTSSTGPLSARDGEARKDTQQKTHDNTSEFPNAVDKTEEEQDRRLPKMELPCAPIYSFDEDGDILQRVETPNLPDVNRNFPRGEETHEATQGSFTDNSETSTDTDAPGRPTERAPDVEETEGKSSVSSCSAARGETREASLCQKKQVEEEEKDARTCSHPILASVGAAEETVPDIDLAEQTDTRDMHASPETHAVMLPEVKVSEGLKVTPKINLHASSVEVEDDYLESHLEDDHLRDLCASLMAECGE